MITFRWFLLLLPAALLASCGGGHPSGFSSTPFEPQPRGTKRPYTIMGQTYTPLLTHEGFRESGIASWYGADFHGRKTSSGERYDMHAMTAAHKTLPMNVYVRVQNQRNGREIVVRINDRGPFVRGRIIDLSYAAAKKLGIVQDGTAPVRIEALGYREAGAGERYRPADYDAGDFAVQVGSFSQRENAVRLSRRLRNLYGHADIKTVRVDGRIFYRVLAGRYRSLRAAERARAKMEAGGHAGSFVVAMD